jgi:hypothetical protein
MHLALPILLHDRRNQRHSASLIRRRTTRRESRFKIAAALLSAVAVAGAAIVLAIMIDTRSPLPLLHFVPLLNVASAEVGPVDDGPAPLTVQTEPAGARIVLDGRVRGHSPLQLHTSIGRHTVLVDADDSISTVELVDVAVTGTVLHVALWKRHPTVQHLRPPYPGAQLADAAFLADGGVQVVVTLGDRQSGQPARQARESWLMEPGSGAERGPTAAPAGSRAAAVAVSPDGRRVATLQEFSRLSPARTSAQSASRRLDSVWVADVDDRADAGTAVFRLEPPVPTMLGVAAQEELAAIAWLPDSRHLLIASRFGDPAAGGPLRTRLLMVDAGPEGVEAIDAQPAELIVVPAEVLLDSAVWSPDRHQVAVMVRAAAAPGAKRVVGLAVIDVSRPPGEAFQYVAELGPEDGDGRLSVAPVAWEPCSPNGVCGVGQRLLYTAPVPNAGSASTGPLGLLGLARPSSATPGGLFVSTVSSPVLASGDAPRLGTATGLVGLAWRSLSAGVDGARLRQNTREVMRSDQPRYPSLEPRRAKRLRRVGPGSVARHRLRATRLDRVGAAGSPGPAVAARTGARMPEE